MEFISFLLKRSRSLSKNLCNLQKDIILTYIKFKLYFQWFPVKKRLNWNCIKPKHWKSFFPCFQYISPKKKAFDNLSNCSFCCNKIVLNLQFLPTTSANSNKTISANNMNIHKSNEIRMKHNKTSFNIKRTKLLSKHYDITKQLSLMDRVKMVE